MTVFEFTVNSFLKMQEWNASLEDLAERERGVLKDRPYFDFLPRVCRGESDAVAESIRSGVSANLSGYRFPCFAGGMVADVMVDPVSLEDGSRGARVRIQVRTYCSAVGKLQQSRHLVDLGKTASILSHGVRNPLNAIKGAVLYLKRRYDDDDNLLEFTGIMEEEITRLDKFISGFLSATLSPFERDNNDINALLKKLEQFVSLQARAVGIDIRFARGAGIPPLDLSVFQIEHAILNVINNAIHALPSGGVIQVTSHCEKQPQGRFVVVEVSDNGPGMPERPIEAFSTPLQETAVTEGKGFGLFITREVLQQHGGSLEICSSRGEGTTVRLLFPVVEEES